MQNRENNRLPDKLTVDTKELQKILSCGRPVACRIGDLAGARVKVGKRVLWNLERIRAYIDSISCHEQQEGQTSGY